jgi:hypothetical protein
LCRRIISLLSAGPIQKQQKTKQPDKDKRAEDQHSTRRLLQPFRKLDHAKKYAIYFVATAEFATGALPAARVGLSAMSNCCQSGSGADLGTGRATDRHRSPPKQLF